MTSTDAKNLTQCVAVGLPLVCKQTKGEAVSYALCLRVARKVIRDDGVPEPSESMINGLADCLWDERAEND